MTPPPKVILSFFFLTVTLAVTAQKNKPSPDDTTSYSVKTETIKGKKYTGFLNLSGFYLLDNKNEIVVFQPGDYFTWELKDFDGDGNKDLSLTKAATHQKGTICSYSFLPIVTEKLQDLTCFQRQHKLKERSISIPTTKVVALT